MRVTRDVYFGTGRINGSGQGGSARERELLLDAYAPVAVANDRRLPALVLAFGGAFHRGSKEDDSYENDRWQNTSIAEYCYRFASRGYVCFSVGYRLTQERPDPGPVRWLTAPDEISRSRMDHVRELLGLPPATVAELTDGMEAAFQDVAAAFNFVHDNAADYCVDPARITIGGFSAGGTSALYAAFAGGVPAAAGIALSGRMEAPDIARYITAENSIPVLQFVGQNDLEYVRSLTLRMADRFADLGIRHVLQHVPGAGHFYPRTAPVEDCDGGTSTVEDAIASFLTSTMGPP